MKTKVCFVSLRSYAVFAPDRERPFGGAEVQVFLLSRELANDPGFEPVAVSRDYRQRDGEVLDGVRQHRIYQGPERLKKIAVVKDAISAWSLFRKLAAIDADVYVQRCAGVETGIVSLYCRLNHKPWILAIASDSDLDGRFERESPAWAGVAFRRGVRSASEVICQNGGQAEMLSRRFGRRGRVILSLSEVPDAYEVPPGREVLWVSRCVPNKRPDLFVELARAFPGQSFVMILNPGPDPGYNRAILELARTAGNLRLIDHVPYRDVEAYYRKARVIVSTADYEGFPNTFLQAMKYGIPVLSRSVDPNEVITRKGAGLLAGGDFERMKDDLTRMMDDEAGYRATSRNAYDYVAAHHDIRRLVVTYKDLLRSVSARIPSRRR